MWKVQLFKLNYDESERNAVNEVLASGWLTMGEQITKFEKMFSEFLGYGTQCVAVANGTAALHMAMLALGIGEGDEVIIPALTFVADANVVRMVGARPVLADSASMDDWNVCAETIERRITNKTKAVIVVHYAGYPCKMQEISALCKEKGIRLIEDVAHAPGAVVSGRKCGAWGDVSCFSFFSNKNLSIGEGGMVVTQDDDLLKRLRYIRSHGMTTLSYDRHMGRAITYDVVEPGLNYRMDEIRAAIGIVQLNKLEMGNRRREELTSRYRYNLKGSGVAMPFTSLASDDSSAYHILPVLLPERIDRLSVIAHLKSKQVQSSIHYPPFWRFTGYAGYYDPEDTPVAAKICEHQLTLPLYPTMTDMDVDYVTSSLLECVK